MCSMFRWPRHPFPLSHFSNENRWCSFCLNIAYQRDRIVSFLIFTNPSDEFHWSWEREKRKEREKVHFYRDRLGESVLSFVCDFSFFLFPSKLKVEMQELKKNVRVSNIILINERMFSQMLVTMLNEFYRLSWEEEIDDMICSIISNYFYQYSIHFFYFFFLDKNLRKSSYNFYTISMILSWNIYYKENSVTRKMWFINEI